MVSNPPKKGSLPKYRQVANSLREFVIGNEAVSEQRLPSDAVLSAQYKVSRLTVIKALQLLESEGLVNRRVGSGTYINPRMESESRVFGLLIPDFGEGEIFEPICRGMADVSRHALLWGNSPKSANTRAERALALCRYFISRKVAGIFFAPIEHDNVEEEINTRILTQLERADIPVVFLDRGVAPFPQSDKYDLVGIDNWREGGRMAQYLLDLGSTRLGFVTRPNSAPTVDARIAGLNQALWQRGIQLDPQLILHTDPTDTASVQSWYQSSKPDAIICANDFTAAQLMKTLLGIGVNVPGQVRLVGFDDVKYAGLLSVPLTTLSQPCREIGVAAIHTMQERLAQPSMAPRTISLPCDIIVRNSCGADLDWLCQKSKERNHELAD